MCLVLVRGDLRGDGCMHGLTLVIEARGSLFAPHTVRGQLGGSVMEAESPYMASAASTLIDFLDSIIAKKFVFISQLVCGIL